MHLPMFFIALAATLLPLSQACLHLTGVLNGKRGPKDFHWKIYLELVDNGSLVCWVRNIPWDGILDHVALECKDGFAAWINVEEGVMGFSHHGFKVMFEAVPDILFDDGDKASVYDVKNYGCFENKMNRPHGS